MATNHNRLYNSHIGWSLQCVGTSHNRHASQLTKSCWVQVRRFVVSYMSGFVVVRFVVSKNYNRLKVKNHEDSLFFSKNPNLKLHEFEVGEAKRLL